MIGDIFIIRIQTCWFLMISYDLGSPKSSKKIDHVASTSFFSVPHFRKRPILWFNSGVRAVGDDHFLDSILTGLKMFDRAHQVCPLVSAIRFLKYKHWLMEIAQKSWDLQIEWVVPRNANRHWSIGVKLVTPKLADNKCTVSCQMLCSSVLPQGCHFRWKIGNTPKCRGSEPPHVDSFQKLFKWPSGWRLPTAIQAWLCGEAFFPGRGRGRCLRFTHWKWLSRWVPIFGCWVIMFFGFHVLWVSKQHGDVMDNWCLTTVIILLCLYWDYYQQGIPSNKPIRWQRCSSRKTLTMRVRFHKKSDGSWVDENHVTCGRLVQMFGFQQCWCRSDITW